MKSADWATLSLDQAIVVLEHPTLTLGGFACTPMRTPWDLSATDFLKFARTDLRSGGKRGLVNAVGNLKRALHCQTDAVLHAAGLLDVATARNWNFNVRLEVLREMAIVAPSILARVNTIRNRVEHDYVVPPSPEDLDAFADMAELFIGLCRPFSAATFEETTWEWTYRGVDRSFAFGRDESGLHVRTFDPWREVARVPTTTPANREYARLMRAAIGAWYRACSRLGAHPSG